MVLAVQGINTATDASGNTTETISNANGGNIKHDATATTTSADGKTVTILRDAPGGATFIATQKEVDASTASGKTITITDLGPYGSFMLDQRVTSASLDRLTRTTSTDSNGDCNGRKNQRESQWYDGNGSKGESMAGLADVNVGALGERGRGGNVVFMD